MTKRKLKTASELGIDDVSETVTDIYMLDIDHYLHREAYFLCPSHEDHSPSASVNLSTGWWHCWSCGAGGDILSLGSKVLKQPRSAIATLTTPGDPDAMRARIIRLLKSSHGEVHHGRDTLVQEDIPPIDGYAEGPMDYMRARGFEDEILSTFNVRYVKETQVKNKDGKPFNIKHCIAIPVYDVDSNHVAWCFRSTGASPSWQPRYFNTTGSRTQDLVFARHKCDTSQPVVVTEGAIDSMWCWQAGHQAVAMYGSQNILSQAKISQLTDFRKVIIFGDRNPAGIKFAKDLAGLLSPSVGVYIVRYRRKWVGDDPNRLSIGEVHQAIGRAVPFHSWVIHNRLAATTP